MNVMPESSSARIASKSLVGRQNMHVYPLPNSVSHTCPFTKGFLEARPPASMMTRIILEGADTMSACNLA